MTLDNQTNYLLIVIVQIRSEERAGGEGRRGRNMELYGNGQGCPVHNKLSSCRSSHDLRPLPHIGGNFPEVQIKIWGFSRPNRDIGKSLKMG